MDQKTFLVSGNKGFIASNLIKKIKEKYPNSLIRIFDKNDPMPVYEVDTVIHLAALARTQECTDDPFGDSFESNINLTNKLLKNVKFNHFIYAGSCACYGTQDDIITEQSPYLPPSVYAAQKAYSEQLIRLHLGDKATVLRLFNTYGPGQRQDGGYPNVIAAMIRSIKKNGHIEVTGNGLQTRDFVFIDDVVSAFLIAIEKKLGITMNVCSGVEVKILDLAILISELTGAKIKFIQPRQFDIFKQVGSNLKASLFMNWQPTIDLKTGITQTLQKEGLI